MWPTLTLTATLTLTLTITITLTLTLTLALARQHVAHLNAFRRRLARGVTLARLLNRTVVLPRFWCYCDRYLLQ